MKIIFRIVLLSFIVLHVYEMGIKSDNKNKVQLHTIGDSTMDDQDPNVKDQRGWAQLLPDFFNEDLVVINPAKSGSSTRSFYEEGYWDNAKKNIQPGDYVLIQFGHNDEKNYGVDGKIGTVPTKSYREYLIRYVNEVRALKANPILCTPVVRKMFGKVNKISRRGKHDLGEYYAQQIDEKFDANDTLLMNYSANMKIVAKQLQCPLIDMTASTEKFVNNLGEKEAAKQIYSLPNDGTHFAANGAYLFAKLFVDQLKQENLLTKYIVPDKKLFVYNQKIEMPGAFLGTEILNVFDIVYDTNSKITQGKITISVSDGFELAMQPKAHFSKELTIDTANSNLKAFNVCLKVVPKTTGTLKGQIKITSPDGETRYIELILNAVPIPKDNPITVLYKLSGDLKATVNGPANAFDESISGLEMVRYVLPEDTDVKFKNKKVQELKIEGGKWPDNEIDLVHSRYIQFAIKTPNEANVLTNSIAFFMGGGANFRVIASTDSDFKNEIILGEQANVTTKNIAKYQYKLNKKIQNGKTLYVRIYPWNNQSVNIESIYLCDVTINGASM